MSSLYEIIIFHRDFGDLHANSIDEPYYRSAVLHHESDQHAYVFSVPFDAGTYSCIRIFNGLPSDILKLQNDKSSLKVAL
jgi:hypothetical protein